MSTKECCVIASSAKNDSSIKLCLEKYTAPTCQFKEYTDELYCHENEYFCPLHLPLKSPQKKEINFEELLEKILNGKHPNFNYIQLSNLIIDFNKYKKYLKRAVLFRGVNLSQVKLSNLSNNRLVLESADCKEYLYLINFENVRIEFDDVLIHSDVEDFFPFLISQKSSGFEISGAKNIDLLIDRSTISSKILLCDGCEFLKVKLKDSTIGWNENYKLNFENIKFNFGDVKIHNLIMDKCDIYLALDVIHPEKITNFDLESSNFFQAPFFRGDSLSKGNKVFPRNFPIDLLGKISDDPNKFYYTEVNKFRSLFSLCGKYNLREDENYFYCLSQKNIEKTNKIDRVQKFTSQIYGNLSSYGTSIQLPIIWILYFTLLGWIIYYFDPSTSDKAFELSIISMVKPLNFKLYSEVGPGLISKIFNVFQSVISVPLWFFFILSFHWNFKRNIR